jgi:hypothetical protein
MIDIVYPMGRGSVWQDNELKYSLRSISMYLKNMGKVVIIGHCPEWCKPDIHIPLDDLHLNISRNIKDKIYRAAKDERITEDFMVFNDDYFFLRETDITDYPFYYKCNLEYTVGPANQGNAYQKYAQTTYDLLKAKGLTTFNYDTHKPIIYNKAKFIEIADAHSWKGTHGPIIKSLYCNVLGVTGVPEHDCKINHPHVTEVWRRIIQGKEMISIGDRALNRSFKELLRELYPSKSPYEI